MAPFKLHFSKFSKSRSESSQGSSRNNSVESEEPQHNSHHKSHRLLQLGSTESVESSNSAPIIGDAGSFVSVNTNSTVPASSPPPSYERVLEEVRTTIQSRRLQRSMAEDEEAIEESFDSESDIVRNMASLNNSNNRLIVKSPEIIHKSSKEFYKAMAKQCGITCKMSDNCRCLDCQSHYFDCDYEKYEKDNTDGGLGAGAPMFLNEVMHGTACSLL